MLSVAETGAGRSWTVSSLPRGGTGRSGRRLSSRVLAASRAAVTQGHSSGASGRLWGSTAGAGRATVAFTALTSVDFWSVMARALEDLGWSPRGQPRRPRSISSRPWWVPRAPAPWLGGHSEVSGRVGTILSIDRRPLCSPPCVGLGVRPQGLSCDLWVPVAGSGLWSPYVTAGACRGLRLDLPRAAPSAASPLPPGPLVWAGGCVLEGSRLGQARCPLGLSPRTLPKPQAEHIRPPLALCSPPRFWRRVCSL